MFSEIIASLKMLHQCRCGTELAQKIKKVQFDISGMGVDEGQVPQIWEAVLAA